LNKRVVFIGNRVNVLEEVFNEPSWEIIEIFAVAESSLTKYLDFIKSPYREFRFRDRKAVIEEIQKLDFDILVSNGCPFILPIDELTKPSRLLINTHPSVLPALKGPHPINGLFLLKQKHFGATTHYMVNDVDSGGIIAQIRYPLTEDLDLGLVYRLSFLLEADVFRLAITNLQITNYHLPGTTNNIEHSYYKRVAEDLIADSVKETAEDILIKVRAFGVLSLGVTIKLAGNKTIKVFNADIITNELVAEKFGSTEPGTITLEYEGNLIIQCAKGLLRISKWIK